MVSEAKTQSEQRLGKIEDLNHKLNKLFCDCSEIKLGVSDLQKKLMYDPFVKKGDLAFVVSA